MVFDIGDVSKRKQSKKDQQNNLHQSIFGAVYLNDIARATLSQSRPLIYPEGAVIVREKLETEAGSPELLTAMIKRQKGFNPAANDWEFLLISGDAKKIKKREKAGNCQSCHASVSAKDFVFDNYLPASATDSSAMRDRHSELKALKFGVPELRSKQTAHVVQFR